MFSRGEEEEEKRRTSSSGEIILGFRRFDEELPSFEHVSFSLFSVLDVLETGTGGGREGERRVERERSARAKRTDRSKRMENWNEGKERRRTPFQDRLQGLLNANITRRKDGKLNSLTSLLDASSRLNHSLAVNIAIEFTTFPSSSSSPFCFTLCSFLYCSAIA